AGEALLAVRADPGEAQPVLHRRHLPRPPVEAALAAVQRMRSLAGGERVRPPVQLEAGAADPVGVPPDHRPEEQTPVLEIALRAGEPQHHAALPARTVRY